ncbi:hypothetical protein C8Q77DRAFT_298380 [Trametes polyzona]|nr:hypothetical protein C8Q77DRAFT_298380 [Trametes polyzona]
MTAWCRSPKNIAVYGSKGSFPAFSLTREQIAHYLQPNTPCMHVILPSNAVCSRNVLRKSPGPIGTYSRSSAVVLPNCLCPKLEFSDISSPRPPALYSARPPALYSTRPQALYSARPLRAAAIRSPAPPSAQHCHSRCTPFSTPSYLVSSAVHLRTAALSPIRRFTPWSATSAPLTTDCAPTTLKDRVVYIGAPASFASRDGLRVVQALLCQVTFSRDVLRTRQVQGTRSHLVGAPAIFP